MSGLTIFFQAVVEILRRPVEVAQITVLPFLVTFLAELWDAGEHDGVWFFGGHLWQGFGGANSGLAAAISYTCTSLIYVVIVGASWHRLILLQAQPGRFAPRVPFRVAMAYGLWWFLLSMGIMLIIGVPLALVYYSLAALNSPLGTPMFWQDAFDPQGQLLFGIALSLGMLWLFFAVMFRIGLCLPVKASFGATIGLRQSRDLTRPLRGTLMVAALCLALFNLLIILPGWVFSLGPVGQGDGSLWVPAHMGDILLSALLMAVAVLIEASLLNAVLMRCYSMDGPETPPLAPNQ